MWPTKRTLIGRGRGGGGPPRSSSARRGGPTVAPSRSWGQPDFNASCGAVESSTPPDLIFQKRSTHVGVCNHRGSPLHRALALKGTGEVKASPVRGPLPPPRSPASAAGPARRRDLDRCRAAPDMARDGSPHRRAAPRALMGEGWRQLRPSRFSSSRPGGQHFSVEIETPATSSRGGRSFRFRRERSSWAVPAARIERGTTVFAIRGGNRPALFRVPRRRFPLGSGALLWWRTSTRLRCRGPDEHAHLVDWELILRRSVLVVWSYHILSCS